MNENQEDPTYRVWQNMIARAGDNARAQLIWRTYDANGLVMVVHAHGTVRKLVGRCRGLGPPRAAKAAG